MVNEAIWVKTPPRNTVEDDRSDSYFWQVTQVKSVSLNHDAIVIVPRLRLLSSIFLKTCGDCICFFTITIFVCSERNR